MAHPVYVLLPADVEWIEVAGTTSQRPAPVRWYLRQSMLEAAVQIGVLVEETEAGGTAATIAAVVRQAQALGGVAVDAQTQELLEPQHVS